MRLRTAGGEHPKQIDYKVFPAKVHLSKQAKGLILLSHPWNILASNYCMCLSTWSDKTLIGQSADKAIDLVALVLLGLQYFLEICFSTRGTENNNFKKEIFFQQQVASIFILHSWFYSVSSFNHLQWLNQRLINRTTQFLAIVTFWKNLADAWDLGELRG